MFGTLFIVCAMPWVAAQDAPAQPPNVEKVPELGLGELPKLFARPLDVKVTGVVPVKPVCSARIVEADPTIDPEIVVPVPQGPVEYTLQIIPPACVAAEPKPQPPAPAIPRR
jgi:hypothetical protein